MQHDGNISPEYNKGFNEGYLLAQHMPELSEKLASIKSDSPRMQGMIDGRKEFLIEKELGRQPVRQHMPSRGKDLGRE
jgi:hypothetical protein